MSDEPCTCERRFGYTCPQHTESWVATQLRDPEMARAIVDEFGEELQRVAAERDSLATQLEQMRRERDDARAKLARISRAISHRYMLGETADETCRTVLRIIDEKEGGQ